MINPFLRTLFQNLGKSEVALENLRDSLARPRQGYSYDAVESLLSHDPETDRKIKVEIQKFITDLYLLQSENDNIQLRAEEREVRLIEHIIEDYMATHYEVKRP